MLKKILFLFSFFIFASFLFASNNIILNEETGEYSRIIGNIVKWQGTYASIYCNDGSTTTVQSIPTGATYTKITAFDANGLSKNCTADFTNDKITITKNGVYKVSGVFSITCATPNVVVYGAAFLDAVEQSQTHFTRFISSAGDVGSCSFDGFITVSSAPVDLDFRLRHNNGGSVNVAFPYANFNCTYIGEN